MKTITGVHFRFAQPSDLDQLIELARLAYGRYAANMSSDHFDQFISQATQRESWEDIVHQSTGFVCTKDEQIIGMSFIFSSGIGWRFFEKEWAFIRMVAVHPNWQNRGIAKELTTLCISKARQSGERIVALHTSEMQSPAYLIYEALGFKKFKELEPRFDNKFWIYTLDLTV